MPLNYKKSRVAAALLLNFLIYIPCKLISALLFSKTNSKIKRLLIQDGYRLGDALMISRVLKHLRQAYPETELHFITSPEVCRLLANSGWVDVLIPFRAPWCFSSGFFISLQNYFQMISQLSRSKYDCAIDFQGDPRGCLLFFLSRIPLRYSFDDFGSSALCSQTFSLPADISHQVRRYEYLFEKVTSIALPEFISPYWPAQQSSDQGDQETAIERHIVMHVGASGERKRWSPANYAKLADLCVLNDFQVTLIGGPGDEALLRKVKSLCIQPVHCLLPDFRELEAVIKKAGCIVCNDSFMAHTAWAFKKKSIIMYGPMNPAFFAPFTGPSVIAWNDRILRYPYREWTRPVDVNLTAVQTVYGQIIQYFGEN